MGGAGEVEFSKLFLGMLGEDLGGLGTGSGPVSEKID